MQQILIYVAVGMCVAHLFMWDHLREKENVRSEAEADMRETMKNMGQEEYAIYYGVSFVLWPIIALGYVSRVVRTALGLQK